MFASALLSGRRRRKLAALAAVVGIAATTMMLPAPAAEAAGGYSTISGDGSSFAFPAIDQWRRDVARRGLQINYTPSGSASGRADFAQEQADFAGTDIQYLLNGQSDPFLGGHESIAKAYSYIPIVAGGTSFPYNLKVGNRQITDLRLSGLTIAKIFTGVITNWGDKAITKDYGAQLPRQAITVVTRSDPSGASYQFTRYLSKTYPSIWNHFCGTHNGPSSDCGPTQAYPGFQGSQQRQGSDQVANFIGSSYGEGSIAYNEYSYSIARQQPVVKVLNAAGYYVLPTDSNVAIALQKAQINENIKDVNFLIQNLDQVYGYKDPRTYPISSYSYLVVPRYKRGQYGPPERFKDPGKGRTLSTWLNYVLCGAQQSSGQLGYSPLPVNLVRGGFKQVLQIPNHVGIPNQSKLSNCNNPTFSNGVNKLIRYAKFPSPCDKIGSPLNCVVRNGKATGNGQQVAGTGGSARRSSGSGNATVPGGGTGTGGGGTGGAVAGPTSGPSGTANTGTDPLSAGGTSGGSDALNTSNQQGLVAQSVNVSDRSGGTVLFSVLTGLEILAALLVPALLGTWLQRRRRA